MVWGVIGIGRKPQSDAANASSHDLDSLIYGLRWFTDVGKGGNDPLPESSGCRKKERPWAKAPPNLRGKGREMVQTRHSFWTESRRVGIELLGRRIWGMKLIGKVVSEPIAGILCPFPKPGERTNL